MKQRRTRNLKRRKRKKLNQFDTQKKKRKNFNKFSYTSSQLPLSSSLKKRQSSSKENLPSRNVRRKSRLNWPLPQTLSAQTSLIQKSP